MPKSLTLGNGQVLIGFDKFGQIYDLYYPFVGLENHTDGSYIHKIGIFVDNRFSWIDDRIWQVYVDASSDSLMGEIKAINQSQSLELVFRDIVYNEKNIIIRNVCVRNLSDRHRAIKMFFNQQFEIYESRRGDTAFFDPRLNTIIHYKGRRVFLINLQVDERVGVFDYSVGLLGMEGKEGTYKDAEDGQLTKNPIEHGLVDSVAACTLEVPPKEEKTFYYWLAVGKSIQEVHELNNYVIARSPQHLTKTAKDYWNAWVNKENFSFYGLSGEVVELFKKSLFIIRSHMDNNGSIIASGDSDMLKHGRDTYSYMWPRDAAFCAMALDKARYTAATRNFFEFCNDVVTKDGYFLHKYRSDKSLGSSWHPWIRNGETELPIQEDETALVLIALWEHYVVSRNIETIERLYNPLIRRSADFMIGFVDGRNGLPRASYDLWEEKFGVSTFTCSAVYAALIAAGKFSTILGKTEVAELYNSRADQIKSSILKYLFNEKSGVFYKMLNIKKDGNVSLDETLDMSSVYGAYKFGILELNSEKLKKLIQITHERLEHKTGIGGFPRYENDPYYRNSSGAPSNPWFVTTLWIVQYYVSIAKSPKDFDLAIKYLEWVTKYALPSGVLSEQLNPKTGEQLSAAPLSWSHAEFVTTIIEYLEKLADLGICETCIPPK